MNLSTSFPLPRVASLGAIFSAFALAAATACSSTEIATDAGTTSQTDANGATDALLPSTDAAPDTSQTASDAGKDGGQTAQEKTYCDAVTKSVCIDGGTPQPCDPESRCLFGRVMSAAGMQEFLKCKVAPACGSEDACIRNAGLTLEPTKAQAYEDTCLAKRTTCNDNFKDDFCSAAIYAFGTGVIGDGEACITKACADIPGCFSALDTKIKSAVAACMAE